MIPLITVLDSGGVLLLVAPLLFVAFMIGIVFIESWILCAFINLPYKQLWIQSLVANLASLGAGLVTIPIMGKIGGVEDIPSFLISTLIVETLVLYLFNSKARFKFILYCSVLMNLLTYLILFLIMWL